uniref:Beta-mannosidase A n=1 Tax=Aspergillus aculeatus TaxID=5053 RepID=MANBA_ASPAC|nr:RecName: Full=Beta-mannosidase A; AltName: Full=Mannanase A; Short=Mannase A; Flags: Precursor [Aspergillus aculeatus]BAA29029.1 beta-mannosidase [Aspergillus aculeatus]
MRALPTTATTLLGVLFFPSASRSQYVRDLGTEQWTLSSATLNRTVPAQFPSQVHMDLLREGIIDEPYNDLNDFNLRWIADANWTYTSGKIEGLGEDYESTWLVFDGLDTFASISFCGQFVGATDNQFRQYMFDVSSILKACPEEPTLGIQFGSAPNIVDAIAQDPSSPTWPEGVQITYEYPNRWFMRKEQSDFGWDWGPAFAPAGPWKPGYVVQLKQAAPVYVRNTDLDIYRLGQINYLPPDQTQPWVVNASLDYLGSLPENPSMAIEVKDLQSGEILASRPLTNITVTEGSVTGVTVLEGVDPKLWWPQGLGDQNLYNVTISVTDGGNQSVAEVTKRTGFRTIFLNQRNITDAQLAQGIAPGANWHFEVNGHEFYAKGSNLIPPDCFWTRVTEDTMTRLFDAVVAGNQNMLRVWSSGAYLHDYIYDLADEKGILLCSEFQFSDALYPTDDAFLENVAAEVVYNVRRVNHHPSLALWAGGNEIESLMLLLVEAADPESYPFYVGEYEKMYISLFLPLVYENTRSISYSPSSTTEGYLDIDLSAPVPMAERYSNTTEGEYYGDTDHYNYDASIAFDYGTYPVGRFANEFGFHSMPSLQTWQQALTDPADLTFNSSVVMLRNHHYPAGGLMTDNYHNTVARHGRNDPGRAGLLPDAQHSVRPRGQLQRLVPRDPALPGGPLQVTNPVLPAGQRAARTPARVPVLAARGHLAGALVGGDRVRRPLEGPHYVARDIYKPVIVSPFWNYTTGALDIYVTSDLWTAAAGSVTLTWRDLSGKPIASNGGLPTKPLPFHVGALNSTRLYRMNMKQQPLPRHEDAILALELTATGSLPNTDEEVTFTHEQWFTPAFPKDLDLVNLRVRVEYDAPLGKFAVEATAGVALYTWLEHPEGVVGYFEENSFVVVPGQKKVVGFVVQADETDGEWVHDVTVRSLWDLNEGE